MHGNLIYLVATSKHVSVFFFFIYDYLVLLFLIPQLPREFPRKYSLCSIFHLG